MLKEGFDPWKPERTYVIGHQRPDTDAVASALGYAWYLSEMGQQSVTAARAGQIADQTAFALKHFGVKPPRLLAGVAPTFGHVARTQQGVMPNAPLSEAMNCLASGERIVPVVDEDWKPCGAVTPLAIARAYAAGGGKTDAFAQPCKAFCEPVAIFEAQNRISDHRNTLLRSDGDDFIVVNERGEYIGVATRGRILQPPRAQLVLVDHNELDQAVAGANEAEIIAVLDHHRLGNPQTAAPIPFVVEPVGSTCTLVAEHCLRQNLNPPAGLAGMMLSGILADTLIFRSPTTTDRDITAGEFLAHLSNTNYEEYGNELLRAAPGLNERPPDEIVDADRKSYQMGGKAVSVAQVEVTDMQALPSRRVELLAALERVRERENLAFICLMITDVVTGRSRLLCQGNDSIIASLTFARLGENEFDLGDIVSRKKQLIPTLHAIIEEDA